MDLTYSPELAAHGPETAARRRAAASAGLVPEAAVARPVRPGSGRHAVGLGVVVAVHALLGYALLSGLAQKVVDVVRQPVEVRLIEAVRPPPPAPPRPLVKTAPRVALPPPVYVPPPLVAVDTPPAPAIAAVTQAPPPAPAPPAPVAAPPAPAAAPAPVAIGVVCPVMVRPELPRRAQQEGIAGSVRAQAVIRGGKVVQVDILGSKPRGLFDAAVRTAMLQYGCTSSGAGDIVATQNFEFKADE